MLYSVRVRVSVLYLTDACFGIKQYKKKERKKREKKKKRRRQEEQSEKAGKRRVVGENMWNYTVKRAIKTKL